MRRFRGIRRPGVAPLVTVVIASTQATREESAIRTRFIRWLCSIIAATTIIRPPSLAPFLSSYRPTAVHARCRITRRVRIDWTNSSRARSGKTDRRQESANA